MVIEGGPRRLWAEVEALAELWQALGRPARERFGLTIDPAGQRVWLDDPSEGTSWTRVRRPRSAWWLIQRPWTTQRRLR